MERKEIKNILEVLFFVADRPISLDKLNEIFDNSIDKATFIELIDEIKKEYNDRPAPMGLRQIAEGYQFATKPEYGQWIRKLFKDRVTLKLSSSALETLAIVSYKQPITRAEIEEIRGVETISVLETLLERKLIRIIGRKETVGRPLLYGTTNEFLRYFGLVSLSDLPSIEELSPPEALFATESTLTDQEQQDSMIPEITQDTDKEEDKEE